jgi:hypothetical protein
MSFGLQRIIRVCTSIDQTDSLQHFPVFLNYDLTAKFMTATCDADVAPGGTSISFPNE